MHIARFTRRARAPPEFARGLLGVGRGCAAGSAALLVAVKLVRWSLQHATEKVGFLCSPGRRTCSALEYLRSAMQ